MKKILAFALAIAACVLISGCGCERKNQTYVVTFDSDGGTTVASQTVVKGGKVKEPTDPTKEGYEFVSWNLGDDKYDFNQEVKGNLSLKAVWGTKVAKTCDLQCPTGEELNETDCRCEKAEKEDSKTTYTVTFDSNGGSKVGTQTVKSGETANRPSNPSRSGYTFVEWQLNNKTFKFTTAITGNITLKAVWKKNQTTQQTTQPTNPTPTPDPTPEPEPAKVTYSVEKVAESGDIAGRNRVRIKSSEGNYVAGTISYNYSGDGQVTTVAVDTNGILLPQEAENFKVVSPN